jgi:hypothetical protein
MKCLLRKFSAGVFGVVGLHAEGIHKAGLQFLFPMIPPKVFPAEFRCADTMKANTIAIESLTFTVSCQANAFGQIDSRNVPWLFNEVL